MLIQSWFGKLLGILVQRSAWSCFQVMVIEIARCCLRTDINQGSGLIFFNSLLWEQYSMNIWQYPP